MKRYFAYGTLLDLASMQDFAPSATPNGVMMLEGYQLDFAETCRQGKGGCWLIPRKDAVTYGLEYTMSDEDMARLDVASGVPDGLWVHKPVTVTDAQGNKVETVTYTIPGEPAPFNPGEQYVSLIRKGMAALDLPPDYVERINSVIEVARARP